MIITVLKTHFINIKPTSISCRSYKTFDLDSFRNELNISLHSCAMNNMKYDQFKAIFMSILKKYAPIKSNTIRGNNRPFMNKTLSKSFMERSRLKIDIINFPPKKITQSSKNKEIIVEIWLLKRKRIIIIT